MSVQCKGVVTMYSCQIVNVLCSKGTVNKSGGPFWALSGPIGHFVCLSYLWPFALTFAQETVSSAGAVKNLGCYRKTGFRYIHLTLH